MIIVGCGQLGSIFARTWREREPEDALICTVRSETSRSRLAGLDVRIADLLEPASLGVLRGASRVLVSVTGEDAWATGMQNLVQAIDPGTHVVFISSTGVYAESDGAEVDEAADLVPGSALVAGEAALSAVPATILRCSGLMGPDRGPHRVLDRIAGSSRPDGWLNLVWMDDVAEVIVEAFARPVLGTFNVSGSTVLRSEFYDPLIAAAGLEPVQWGPGPPGKRVRADRLRTAFDTRLRAVVGD